MKRFTIFTILFSALVVLTACNSADNNSAKSTTIDKSDLTACGNFPKSSGDGGPTSRYHVCRNTETGECFYSKSYYEQIKGCDPEFDPDTNPYGNDECFEWLTDTYDFEGKLDKKGVKALDNNVKCETTYQDYFESKVKE